MENFLRDFWGLLIALGTAFITGVIAFGKMEGRLSKAEDELRRMSAQRHEDRERETQDRNDIKAMLKEDRAEIMARLGELAADVKDLRKEHRQ